MIGYLEGKIKHKLANSYIILVGGVGYEVHIYYPQEIGVTKSFFIHTDVKETEISLWGFEDTDLLKLFRALLNVSGVGTKTGFFLVHSKAKEDIVNAIKQKDPKGLKVKGIGPKTAQKIILELHGKIDEIIMVSASVTKLPTNIDSDLIDALLALGYTQKDVNEVLEEIPEDILKEGDHAKILRLALSML